MFKAYAAIQAGAKLELIEFEPSPIGADEVEIDVENCGICHSDLSMIDNEWGMSTYPLIAGHEVIGLIRDKGAAVSQFKIGQRVGLGWFKGFCNHCQACQQGDHNLCSASDMTIVGNHGGFADKVRAKANSVVALPDGIDPLSAGPMFCGGITVFNPLVQFNLPPTSKVGVIGIGGLGHIALQFLNAWGCDVTAFTSSEAKIQEAKSLGAHHTIDSRDPKALEDAAGQFDLILSTVAVKLDWNAYLNTLAPKGRLHFVGATLAPLDLNVFNLIMAQRSVSGTPSGSPETTRKMLDFARLHDIKPQIETFAMRDINQAIQHLRDGKARYRIVLEN
ncbi:MAG: NAD(P)-dependent alcohol dehydrogenase [Methylophaga sp.]|nr:NAD(P)-dependent alcohol dehydrogenase [Methylophaga sp.]